MVKKRRVTFFAGVKTPSKKDDRVVDFLAAPKGMTGGIQLDGLQEPKSRGRKRIDGFDSAFGLGGMDFSKGLNPELASPFASNETKVSQKEIGFGRSFFEDEQSFLENDPEVPEAISENFDEPTEDSLFDTGEDPESVVGVDFGVPNLFESIQEISLGKRVPKVDGLTRTQRLENKFRRTRMEALETGGNPLTPEEQSNFEAGPKFTRNFGTTSRGSTGLGFGRF